MKGNKEEEFLAAYNEHSDALFRHAFFRLPDRERAYDLTQDTFIKAWDYVRGGGDVRSPKSFLFRILNNLIIDEYRRSKTESLDKKIEDNPSATEAMFAEGSVWEVEEGMDEKDLLQKVKDAIKELSEEYRTVITLRYVEGFSPKEIARMIGSTENAVSVRIHRGVAKLKSELATS
jgi:RNA polymerase sigma factor (sigma-70 family)